LGDRSAAARHESVHGAAHLCFFAEDTGIFLPQLFTATIPQMSDDQSVNSRKCSPN